MLFKETTDESGGYGIFAIKVYDTGFEKVFVSAGKVGYQIELSPADLKAVSGCKEADIIV